MASSHPDSDHLLGLFSVVKEIAVARVILPPVPEPPGDYADFINLLETRKINYSTATKGTVAHLGPDVHLEVLHPVDAAVRAGSGDNNNFMVLKLVYGSTSVLLTGDIEREAMDELLASTGDLRSTVIKMPHHGSKSGLNREFLRRVAPEAVVISVGRNSFGHPSAEILNFWSAEGIPVYRTDLLGAVSFYSDGSQWSIEGLHRKEQQEKNPGVSGRGLSYVW
ncbi:MAG: ComEC/Rec2 family competence protein [Bacillota bacterium]